MKSWSLRKKKDFLYRLFFPKEIFFNIWVLSQRITYWTNFFRTYIFLHIKNHYFILLHTLICLCSKSSKVFSVSLIISKEDFSTGVFLWIFCEIFNNTNFVEHLQWLFFPIGASAAGNVSTFNIFVLAAFSKLP